MAKKRSKLPDKIMVGLETYIVGVAMIQTRDKHGRPKLVTLIHPEEVVTLNEDGGEEFMTLFAPKRVMGGER